MSSENSSLYASNDELEAEVTQLSLALNQKVEEEASVQEKAAQASLPKGFPLSSSASYKNKYDDPNADAADSSSSGNATGNPILVFTASAGSQVVASGDGTVVTVTADPKYGNCITIDHDKKSSLLTFTLGTTGLDRPLDKRYFYACDASGHIYGYNVYCPYNAMAGYMADITRRSYDAPSGITEKIMYEAMQTFKAEGIKTVSMGLAPLANIIQEGEPAGSTEKLLHFVYEHLNSCYGFKNLYHAKESYSPTDWLPGYYAWFPGTKIPGPEMFYAIARIQNKEGMREKQVGLCCICVQNLNNY